MARFPFRFAAAYRPPALLLAITPRTAWVEVAVGRLAVRFGPWSLRTPLDNIDHGEITGGFAYHRTAGPPHLSFTDRGVTFATNGERALCLHFTAPVKGLDPTGRLLHPAATVTVADPEALLAAVGGIR